jgi:hypothetical protein
MQGWLLRERRAANPEDCGELGILKAGWLRRGLREEQQGKFERTLSEIAVCGRGASDWKQAEGSDFRI